MTDSGGSLGSPLHPRALPAIVELGTLERGHEWAMSPDWRDEMRGFEDFDDSFKQQRNFVVRLSVLGLLLNVAIICGVVYGLWCGYNHVISPSFDTPQLQVK